MTDFTLYDVPTVCRECGTEYQAKAFLPPGTEPRFGLCPPCREKDDAMMDKLKQPPKVHGRPKDEPEPGNHPRGDRVIPTISRRNQTRWEPRD